MKYSFDPGKAKIKDFAEVAVAPQKHDEIVTEKGRKKIVLGVEDGKKINRRKLIVLARKIITLAKANKIKKIAVEISDFVFPGINPDQKELARILGTNFEMANYEFNKYKQKPKEGWDFVREVALAGKLSSGAKKEFQIGKIIGQAANIARDLSNTPGGFMTPRLLAKEAGKILTRLNVKTKILGKKEMQKMKMGGVLSVGQGSSEEARFIILEYRGNPKKEENPLVLVGKAITFDTGGINLKPSRNGSLHEMHMDMSGGAAAIAALWAAAKLKIAKNIIALIPAAENMPSGSSYRPGDIIKMLGGKTVEVGNTDAEGRIVLADALTYAKKYRPRLVVDIATLTGASIVALGFHASAIISNNEKYHKIFKALGEKSGDYVWPLPLWEEYEEEVKGQIGDVNNIGKFEGAGGTITAAAFLYQFAKDYPWVHIDIAPRMTSVEGEQLAKGAAGAPVRLLVEMLEKL